MEDIPNMRHWCRKTDTCWEGREPTIMTSQGQWLAQSCDEAIAWQNQFLVAAGIEETKRSNARRIRRGGGSAEIVNRFTTTLLTNSYVEVTTATQCNGVALHANGTEFYLKHIDTYLKHIIQPTSDALLTFSNWNPLNDIPPPLLHDITKRPRREYRAATEYFLQSNKD